MAFQIVMTDDAERQFLGLTAREQRELQGAVRTRLIHEPRKLSNAIKKMRPNLVGEFELRVGVLRAIYNVGTAEVTIVVIGHKLGNKLVVEGEEFHGHRVDPSQPSGEKPPEDADGGS